MLNLLLLSLCLVTAPEWEAFSSSATPGGRSIGCQLLRPDDATEPKPLLVILHGSGERGYDNRLQLKFLPQLMASPKRRADFPCYVLVPQCPPNEMWSVLSRTRGIAAPFGDAAEDSMRSVESAILQLLETENIDASRMYVCGLSMGGFGTWDLIWRRPEWFAAAGPICGGANPQHAPKYVGRAIWNWHGDADQAVSVELSDQILSAIRNLGGSPKETRLPGVGHNSWNQAHADGQLVDWLFTHRFDPLDSARGGELMLKAVLDRLPPERKITIVDKAGSLMRPVLERLGAYDNIDVVDRAPAAGDLVLLAPRGNLQELPRIRSEMSNANIQLMLVTAPRFAGEPRTYEQRYWTMKQLARMQVIPFADVRRSADSAAPVWSRMGHDIVANGVLTEAGASLAFRTVAEKLAEMLKK